MGQKRILPEHIKSVKHSFEDMSSRIEEFESYRFFCDYSFGFCDRCGESSNKNINTNH